MSGVALDGVLAAKVSVRPVMAVQRVTVGGLSVNEPRPLLLMTGSRSTTRYKCHHTIVCEEDSAGGRY